MGRRADGPDDPLADAGDDRLFRGAADEPVELGPHGDASPGPELDAVLADAVERRPALGRIGAVDDLRIDAGADRVEDVAPRQIDGGRDRPRQIDPGLVSRDHRRRRPGDVAARQVVGGPRVPASGRPGRRPARAAIFCLDDEAVVGRFCSFMRDQFGNADLRSGEEALDPCPEEAEEDDRHEDADEQQHQDADQHHGVLRDAGEVVLELSEGGGHDVSRGVGGRPRSPGRIAERHLNCTSLGGARNRGRSPD